jgi:hypothetical protein
LFGTEVEVSSILANRETKISAAKSLL